MKTIRKIFLITSLVAVFHSMPAVGLSKNGTWNATEISSEQVVAIDGTVTLKGLITINNGGKLTIKLDNSVASGTNITIRNRAADKVEGMFYVEKGGQLTITGNANSRIILDGGAFFTTVLTTDKTLNTTFLIQDADLKKEPDHDKYYTLSRASIRNSGTCTLNYVTIRNVNNVYGKDGVTDYLSSRSGGAVCHTGTDSGTTTNLNNCIIEKCKSYTGSAVLMATETKGTVNIKNCEVLKCSSWTSNSGHSTGTIRSWGDTETSLNITNTEVHHCFANLAGGALYINASGSSTTMCTMKGCRIHNNYAAKSGGGINGGGQFTFSDDGNVNEIYDNISGSNGGGVHFYAYTGGSAPSSKVNVVQRFGSKVRIYHNLAMNGGGIAFTSNNNITLPEKSSYKMFIDGAQIYSNVATENGAGIYYCNEYTGTKYTFNTEVGCGTISQNTATGNGGGLYIYKANIDFKGDKDDTIIEYNEAKNGAGFYITGGNIYMTGGSIILNEASETGGGFYITGGNVTIEGGNVASNTAEGNGGGAYVNGGDVEFINGALVSNTALNGGGFYMASGTSMKYIDGLIAHNTAKQNETAITTAYNAKTDVAGVNGCGGGIYLQSGTSSTKKTALTIEVNDSFGLYSNLADRAGDDVVAEGKNTTVILPNVKQMDLRDFEGRSVNPNWYEDYVYPDDNGDTKYKGYGILRAINDNSGKRFRDMVSTGEYSSHLVEFTEDSKTFSDYVCLTLGYQGLSIIINTTGLHENESALYVLKHVVRHDDESEWIVKESYPVLISGSDIADGKPVPQKIIRNLLPGYYIAEPFGQADARTWAWAYKYIDPTPTEGLIQILKDVRDEKDDHNLFPFTVEHLGRNKYVDHDEDIKVNEFISDL